MSISPRKEEAVDTGIRSAIGNIINKLASIPISVFVASVLGPLGFGVITIVNLILQYLRYLNLGMLANLQREIPIAHGKNDSEEIKTVYQTIFTNYSITTLVGLLVIFLLFVNDINFSGELLGHHFFLMALIYVFSNLLSFYCAYVKAEGLFIVYGNYELITKVTSPLTTFILVYFFALNGMIASLFMIQIIGLIYILRTIKIPVIKYKIDIKKTLELMSTGLPMFLNKIVDGIYLSIATLLAARYLSSTELGILGFGLGIASIKKVPFANVFMVVIHRKLGLKGGEKGIKNYTEFKSYFGLPLYIYLFLLTSILGSMVIIYLFSVNLFLGDFIDAIPIFFILFFTLNFYNARYFMNSYLDITKQMHVRTIAVVLGIFLNAWLCYLTIQEGLGIFGLALSVSITMILIAVFVIIFSLKQIYQSVSMAIMFLLRLLLISSLLTLMLFLFKENNIVLYDLNLPTFMDITLALMDLGIKLIIFIGSTTLLYSICFYKHNLYEEILMIAGHIFSKLGNKLGLTLAK